MPVTRRKLPTPIQLSTPEPSQQRLLRIPQAAAYLNTSTFTIRELIRRRAVPKIKLGKRFLIDRADLDTYIEQSKAA